MNQTWARAAASLARNNEPWALLTILSVDGDSPQRAGAKMAVGLTDTFDSIGGGEVEFKAIAHARKRLLDGKSGMETIELVAGVSEGDESCSRTLTLLIESWAEPVQEVVLFGAGHVGQALALILGGLPFRVRWIDPRPDVFPAVIADNIDARAFDAPEDAVADAAAGACYLVMTHNHPLDYRVARAVLQRGDADYLGVIGSGNKARRFRSRLLEDGLDAATIESMQCPIRDAGGRKSGRHPMQVAVAIAQMLNERYAERATGDVGIDADRLPGELRLMRSSG